LQGVKGSAVQVESIMSPAGFMICDLMVNVEDFWQQTASCAPVYTN